VEATNENSLLSQWKQRLKDAPSKGISKVPEDVPLVLSHGQQRLWFLQQLNPENPFYNYSEGYTFKGILDVDNLKRALQLVYETHDVLRSTYQLSDGVIRLKVEPNVALNIQEYDLSSLPKSEITNQVSEIMTVDARALFDLSEGPLIRASFIKKAEEEHLLFLTLHHIVGDKWSLEVFNRHLANYYSKLCANEQNVIETLPIHYQDFAYWQLSEPTDEKQLDYWMDKLSGEIPLLDLPKDFKPPLRPSFKGAYSTKHFSSELSSEILLLSKVLGATPYVLLLSVYYILLLRYTGQKDILIGSPISNRDQKVLENLMGFFNDTVVLRTRLNPEMSFKELVALVRDTTLEAFENKNVPFEELVKALKPERSLSVNPFFQAMFLYNTVDPIPSFGPDLMVEGTSYDSGTSKFDLTLFISEENGMLTSSFEYSTDIFADGSISRLQNHLELLLKGVTKNPKQPIGKIPMLTDIEKKLFFPTGVEIQESEDFVKPIHRFIEEMAEKNPTKKAVAFKSSSITYRELNERANQIAHQILEKTEEKNEIVGLCMNRSLEMIIGILAILKSGCAYLPIDPEYPEQRIKFMLKDAGVKLILTNDSIISIVELFDAEIINTDKTALSSINNSHGLPKVNLDCVAYVIYTSGSTGRPKGVPISHKSIVNSTAGRSKFYGNDPKSFLLLSSIAFDSSKAGIFWTLSTGGTLVISEKRMEQDIALLSKTIQENKVSHTLMLPSLYNLLLDFGLTDELQSLVAIVVAGEACSNLVCKKHFDILPEVDLYNEYGPTEATVWCVAHKIEMKDTESTIPIGKPVANAQIHILNDNLENVPYGAVGELCISGTGLTKGYINLPVDNAERFSEISLKLNSNVKTRIYKTGDLARYRRDGKIEFLGRKDQQVKVRGFRIELDEVEKAILNNGSVEKVVVAVESGQRRSESLELGDLETNEFIETMENSIGLNELEEVLRSVENLGDSEQNFLSSKL